MGLHQSNKEKNMRTPAFVLGAFGLLVAAQISFAAYAPDLPLAGWATQNGGTTGGAAYGTVTVDNVSDLKSYASAGNKTIYIKAGTYAGTITVGSNVTLYGYPGVIITQPSTGSGIKLSGSSNVIIRNITVKGVGAVDEDDEDCLQINHESKNIWIDHVHVYDGHDGNMDIVNASNYITVSWCLFTYTSASTDHQFSNLFGNSDSKTTDASALKITVHHSWWGDGVKERMPRVRFGQVHVVNNLYTSSAGSYCVRAGMKANIRVENNVFIGVKNPLDYNDQDSENATVTMVGNYYEGTSGNTTGQGTAFTPTYSMGVTDVSTQTKAYALRDSIKAYAGPTLAGPGGSTTISSSSVTSSSSVKSSSSIASSSSVTSSSSVVTSSASVSSSSVTGSSSSEAAEAAELEKHGTGSSKQTVAQGAAIASFYYTWTNATGATVSGLPDGVTAVVDADKSMVTISGTVAATVAVGAYTFTVATTGATVSNATKTGTITVTAGSDATSSSSVSSSTSEDVSSSSGTTALPMMNVTTSKLSVSPAMFESALVTLDVNYQGTAKVVLMDMAGRTVMSRVIHVVPGTNEFTINRGALPSGAYFVKVNTAFDHLQGRVLAQ